MSKKTKNINKLKEGKCPPKNKCNCPTSNSFKNSGSIITDNEYEITSEIQDKEKYIEKEETNK